MRKKVQVTKKEKRLVFTWGRFNPPTLGDQVLFQRVKERAGNDDYFIFTSQTQDKYHPLEYKTKHILLKNFFPEHSDRIVQDENVHTLFDAIRLYITNKYDVVEMLVDDRDSFDTYSKLFKKYTEHPSISVHCAKPLFPGQPGISKVLVNLALSKSYERACVGLPTLPSVLTEIRHTFMKKSLGINELVEFYRKSNFNFTPASIVCCGLMAGLSVSDALALLVDKEEDDNMKDDEKEAVATETKDVTDNGSSSSVPSHRYFTRSKGKIDSVSK